MPNPATAATVDDLAYTIAAGPWYYHLGARLLIDSLRRFGGFAGDVVVVTDRVDDKPRSVLPLPIPTGSRAATNPKYAIMSLRHAMDLTRYRRVWYFDSDIIVRGSIMAFCQAVDRTGAIVATNDMSHTVASHAKNGIYLTDDERLRWADRAYANAGFCVLPGGRAPALLATWEDEVLTHAHLSNGGMLCQPGFNSAAFRGRIPMVMLPGRQWHPREDPQREHADPDAPIVHFTRMGSNPKQRYAMWMYHRRLVNGWPDPTCRHLRSSRKHAPFRRGRVAIGSAWSPRRWTGGRQRNRPTAP